SSPSVSGLGRKRSSRPFMAADHFVPTLSQDANLQLPRAAKYGCYVVKGVARHELIQKPQPFLCKREGHGNARRAARDALCPACDQALTRPLQQSLLC